MFLPAASLFSATAVVLALERFRPAALQCAVLVIFAACVAWPLFSERDFFFERRHLLKPPQVLGHRHALAGNKGLARLERLHDLA